jgi:hypothetical protein
VSAAAAARVEGLPASGRLRPTGSSRGRAAAAGLLAGSLLILSSQRDREPSPPTPQTEGDPP